MPGPRALALDALRRYDLPVLRVRLAAESFNRVYRVTASSGVFALRVGAPQAIHPAGTADVEVAWHQRLRRHGVTVPGVRPNRDGAYATVAEDSAGRPRVCLLFDWVTGRSLRTRLTETRSAALGRLSARLHACATDWSPLGGATILPADRVLYWQLPDRLAAAGARFGFGELFADAAARAQRVVDVLWRDPPHRPRLLHGDLTPQNVIVAPGHGLVPIDFQDTVWGFEVQDLAITVTALRRQPDGEQLVAAFRAGYGQSRPWPDVSPALFDALVMARDLHQFNLTLNLADWDGLDGYVADHAARAGAWLRRPAGPAGA
jgi:Ser/Thr protein kinase RdoA (MazF antagonist)